MTTIIFILLVRNVLDSHLRSFCGNIIFLTLKLLLRDILQTPTATAPSLANAQPFERAYIPQKKFLFFFSFNCFLFFFSRTKCSQQPLIADKSFICVFLHLSPLHCLNSLCSLLSCIFCLYSLYHSPIFFPVNEETRINTTEKRIVEKNTNNSRFCSRIDIMGVIFLTLIYAYFFFFFSLSLSLQSSWV